jgi:benzoate-CoA ligase
MLDRPPTAYDEKIYTADWRAYADPAMPETIAPTALLIDRHLGTPVEHKAALLVDGEPVSYRELAARVAAVSAGLAAHGVVRENRILLFGTDSLDYVTMWFGAVRIGAIPAVVSDLYKAPDLLYFLRDTAARFLFIDAEQLPKLVEIAAALPSSLETIFVRGAGASGPSLAGRRVIPFDAVP